jgi:hypothetical protein
VNVLELGNAGWKNRPLDFELNCEAPYSALQIPSQTKMRVLLRRLIPAMAQAVNFTEE